MQCNYVVKYVFPHSLLGNSGWCLESSSDQDKPRHAGSGTFSATPPASNALVQRLPEPQAASAAQFFIMQHVLIEF